MDSKSQAFFKGGCGCLLAFVVLAIIAVAVGGHAHIDFGGAICLFVSGGLLGLTILAIYNKGRRDGQSDPDHLDDQDDRSNTHG